MENAFRSQAFQTVVPPIIGGVIFMVIGLYIMKVGIRKDTPQTVQF
jgi:putative Mn2+ efflux pump MntP